MPEHRTRVIGDDFDVELVNELGVVTHVVSAPPSLVWRRLRDAYTRLEIPITAEDPGTRQLGVAGYRALHVGNERLSRFLDCGASLSGALADVYDVRLAVMSHVRTEPDATEASLVTIVEASAQPRDVSSDPIFCSSKRTLELLIAETVVALLNADAPR